MKKGRELIPLKKMIIILAILMLSSIIYIPAAALELPEEMPPIIEENDPTYGAEYEGYFAISTAEQMRWFYRYISEENSYAKALLVCDIEINTQLFENKITVAPDGEPSVEAGDTVFQWTPVSDFRGVLDGGGHTLSGIFIKESGDNTGLFATLAEGGEVKNLKIADSYIYTSGDNAGVIAGENYGKVTNVSVGASLIVRGKYTGAIAGKNHGEISQSSSIGIVEGSTFVGGISGANFGNISYSYTANDGIIFYVYGTSTVGGIAGENRGNISYSYYASSFKGVGFGIAGATVYGSEIRGCYYLSGADDDGLDGTEKKSRDSFLSGEVCYLLNEAGEVFYQTVGTGLPGFSGESVFKRLSYDCPGDIAPDVLYTN